MIVNFNAPPFEQYGPLKVARKNGSDQKGILLLHGYGANALDLFGLSDFFKEFSGSWFFPEAPLSIGFPGAKAWFPIDAAALELAMQSGSFREFKKSHMEGFEEAKKAVIEMIRLLPIKTENLIIGGFSQGSMLATDICLDSTDRFAGLSILSGTYVEGASWAEKAKTKTSLPIFQSHGKSDPILSFKAAEKLAAELKSSGMQNQEFHSFNGGHEIPLEILNRWKSFVTNCFEDQK